MKHLFLSAAVLTILSASAQKIELKDVPPPVLNKFNAFYPKMKKVVWEKEGADFEAGFKDAKKVKTFVLINAEGNIRHVETVIKTSALPKKINDTIPKMFAGYKVGAISKIDASGLITYKIDVKKGKEVMKLVYADNAALMSKTVEAEEKKEKK